MADANLSAERLRELLDYDPDTGVFTWRINWKGLRIRAGAKAGSKPNDQGYVIICVDGRAYRAHRLAWLYMTGLWPNKQLDHKINGVENRADNRFHNLRESTNKQNSENRALDQRNTVGFRGVSWDKTRGKWYAHITHNYRMISLGRYTTLIDAVAARLLAERTFFTHSQPDSANHDTSLQHCPR